MLTLNDLELDRAAYRAARPSRRVEAIALRAGRRLHVGDLVTLEVENVATLTYQAQEMLYAEGITSAPAAAAELAAYERLMPGPASFTATMMVEVPDADRVKEELTRLEGLHDCFSLVVDGKPYPAHDVPPPDEGPAVRTFSVHFLRFELTPQAVTALAAGAPAEIVVDHPAYRAGAVLPAGLRADLAQEMASSST